MEKFKKCIFFASVIFILTIFLLYANNKILVIPYLLEFFILILLFNFKKLRFLKPLLFLFSTLELIQLFSVICSGLYMVPLTWENLNESASAFSKTEFYSLIAIFLLLLSGYNFVYLPHQSNKKQIFISCFFLILLEFLFYQYFPISSNINSIRHAFGKDIVENDGSEFYRSSVIDKETTWKYNTQSKKNIILIFAEGMSSQVISKEITPNTLKLKNKSISFENYYNHTAATFRGIRGQLISGVQIGNSDMGKTGHEELNYLDKDQPESLPVILQQKGYKTIFVSPLQKDNFCDFIKYIGFQEILPGYTYESLSDKQLYKELFNAIKQNSKTPFLIATYVRETHFGLDSPDKKYGNGKNTYLNKFYNQDYWLGWFLKQMEKEKLLDNTILIFTTDHTSYPSKEFRDTFHTQSSVFSDKIPLFIYNKDFSAEIIDAKGLTSLALTPTILDILGYRNVPNHFLGHSLFEKAQYKPIEKKFIEGYFCYEIKNNTFNFLNIRKDCPEVLRYYGFSK